MILKVRGNPANLKAEANKSDIENIFKNLKDHPNIHISDLIEQKGKESLDKTDEEKS